MAPLTAETLKQHDKLTQSHRSKPTFKLLVITYKQYHSTEFWKQKEAVDRLLRWDIDERPHKSISRIDQESPPRYANFEEDPAHGLKFKLPKLPKALGGSKKSSKVPF